MNSVLNLTLVLLAVLGFSVFAVVLVRSFLALKRASQRQNKFSGPTLPPKFSLLDSSFRGQGYVTKTQRALPPKPLTLDQAVEKFRCYALYKSDMFDQVFRGFLKREPNEASWLMSLLPNGKRPSYLESNVEGFKGPSSERVLYSLLDDLAVEEKTRRNLKEQQVGQTIVSRIDALSGEHLAQRAKSFDDPELLRDLGDVLDLAKYKKFVEFHYTLPEAREVLFWRTTQNMTVNSLQVFGESLDESRKGLSFRFKSKT